MHFSQKSLAVGQILYNPLCPTDLLACVNVAQSCSSVLLTALLSLLSLLLLLEAQWELHQPRATGAHTGRGDTGADRTVNTQVARLGPFSSAATKILH